jgi:hypothetical protein
MATAAKDFLKQNPQYIGMANVANRAQAPKPKKGSKNQSWLSSIISESGGAAGAVSGAAAGAALGSVVPGIGNIVGGIAGGIVGGFAGGTGGRLVENKVRDDEYRVGDALKEGAVSGVFGGVGPAFQGARGLGSLAKAGGSKGIGQGAKILGGMGDDATKIAAGKAISKGGAKAGRAVAYGVEAPNALQVAGRNIAGNAQGIGVGSRAAGLSNTMPSSQDDMLKALKSVGLSRANPEKTLRQLEPVMSAKGTAIANAYKNSTARFTTQQLNDMGETIIRQVLDDPSIQLTRAGERDLLNKLTLLAKKDAPESLWQYQKNLANSINFGKSAEAKLVDREAIARIIRGNTAKLLDDAVPKVRTDRVLYSTLSDAQTLMGAASKQADKSGIAARVMTSAPVRRVEAGVGGAVESAGNVLGSPLANTIGRVAGGTAVRGVANQFMQPVVQDPTQEQQGDMQIVDNGVLTPDALYGSGAWNAPQDTAGAMPDPMGQAPQSSYSLEQAMADISRDPKNAATYKWVYEQSQSQTGSSKGNGLNVTKPTSEKYAQAASGAQALSQLEALLTNNPGVLAKTRTPGRGITALGIGSTIKDMTGTGEYDTLGFATVDNMLRIATGAAAPEGEIRRYMNQYLPAAGDNAATIKAKLDTMRRQFNSILELAGNQQGQDSALSDAIINSGAGL